MMMMMQRRMLQLICKVFVVAERKESVLRLLAVVRGDNPPQRLALSQSSWPAILLNQLYLWWD